MPDLIDFIMAFNPVTFRYISDPNGALHYGLIAQEVEDILNERGIALNDFSALIKEPDTQNEGEYNYFINYMEFIPMLIKMAQELQSEIEKLKAK